MILSDDLLVYRDIYLGENNIWGVEYTHKGKPLMDHLSMDIYMTIYNHENYDSIQLINLTEKI